MATTATDSPAVLKLIDDELDARLKAEEYAPGRFGAPSIAAVRARAVDILKAGRAGLDTLDPVIPAQFKQIEEAVRKAVDLALLLNSIVPASAAG